MGEITSQRKKGAKYRICIVTAILPPAYGGAEVAAFQYALRRKNDPESDMIIIGWDRNGAYKESGKPYDFVHDVSFAERKFEARGFMTYIDQYVHIARCFFALFGPMWKYRDRYDIVHNFNSGFAFNRVSIFVAKLLGKKVVTETSLVGDDDPLSLGRMQDWKDYLKPKHLRYIFYKMADRYVSKSPVITNIFKQSEIPLRKVAEIPYPVDIDEFRPVDENEKTELRRRNGIWENGTIALFVGGINQRKGIHLLVRAFIDVANEFPGFKLMIAGPTYKYDQEYIEGIRCMIRDNGMQDRIRLTEKSISNVSEYMKCADIFVLPSSKEGFPISVIESMSSGLAVIGSDIPEIAEAQIETGKDGFVFRAGDPGELANTFRRFLSDRDLMKRMGSEARKKAVDNWSTKSVDNSYKLLYSRLLSGIEMPPDSVPLKSAKVTAPGGRKIRILYNIPNFNTAGSGKALLNVISRLDKNVFEPEIFCRHKMGSLFSLADQLGIPIHIGNFTTLMKPRVKGLRNVLALAGEFRKIHPDIIHSYNYSDDYSEALASRIAGIKWIYTKKNMSWGSNAWRLRTRLANAIIPQNSAMINTFLKGKDNLHLIPIGIDVTAFSGDSDAGEIIEKYGLRNASPVIITVANVIPIKGIEYLVRGMELILEDYPNSKLLVVGEDRTEYADSLKREVAEKNLGHCIIFTGKQNNIKPFFKVADMFFLSSIRAGEGGPIAVLEAMASSVLCYGSDVPGIQDQFRELPDQLFESENPGAIANKIIHAMELPQDEKQRRIAKQLQIIARSYSIENEVSRLQELYLQILNGRSN